MAPKMPPSFLLRRIRLNDVEIISSAEHRIAHIYIQLFKSVIYGLIIFLLKLSGMKFELAQLN